MANVKIPVALQLYSIRKQAEQDLAGTLKAVAEMGYDGVEFAGYYGRTAQELRTMLDDLGLRCPGTHLRREQLTGDALKETVEFNQVLGNPNLVIAHLPDEMRNTPEACLKSAEMFTQIAQAIAPQGMRVGYHNHFTEFAPMSNGQTAWDMLFSNMPPEVIMQLDTGNAMHGGANPVEYLRRYPGRSITVHLKEYAAGYDKALVGEGNVPWKEVFELCETVGGTTWYIIEQESYALPPLECVAKCRENLRKMGR